MNRKQFLMMLAAVAILGGAGLAMFWQDLAGYKESGAKIGAKVLPNLKAADATEIRLKDAKRELTLVSKNGSWSVKERGNYPADVGEVSELLAKKGATAPACWADLLKPEFKGEIQMANPNSSGTAYVAIATLVQLMGEEKAFDYLRRAGALALARGSAFLNQVIGADRLAILAQQAEREVERSLVAGGGGHRI